MTGLVSPSAAALLKQVLASDSLPSVPVVAANVLALSKDPNVEFARLGAMISADPALVARLLRMANSPYFGARKKITSVNEALVRMGLKVARMAVLGFTLETEISQKLTDTFEIDRFWRQSLTTATAARVLAETVWPARRDDAFSAGILMDVGMIAFQCAVPERYAAVLEQRRLHPTQRAEEIELRELGLTHAEAGAELLRKWGLPEEVYEPVRRHHAAGKAAESAETSDLAKLARLLAFSSTITDVFYSPARGVLQRMLEEEAREQFGLAPEVLERLLERVARDVREICDLFNLDPRTVPTYEAVRLQAAQEVARLAVEVGGQSRQTEALDQERAEEVRQLKAEAEELKKLASTDELTQLLNRREFLRSFVAEIGRARRHGHPLGLLIFDIDHFKTVNDTYGHPAGDKVLAALGRHLCAETRRSDVVARLGGEEFVLLLPETDLKGVVASAEKLRLGIAEASKDWVAQVPGITVSVGAVHARPGSDRLDGSLLIDEADQCLYQAKASGRNCTRYVSV